LNPANVMGAKACTECHGNEVDAWRLTKHFKTFSTLETSDKAGSIADAMGVDDLTSNSACIECHYTLQKQGGRDVAISGISCESCHGAARGWIQEHSKTEPSREQRTTTARKFGMIYPEDLYAVARNCFDCHIVAKEELVNKGGHAAYSKDFDLLAWHQGEVRHNFMIPGDKVKASGEKNRPASAERRRMLYLIGKLLTLEYSLRGVGVATAGGKLPSGEYAYGTQQALRFDGVRKEVDALASLAPEIGEISKLAKAIKLSTKKEERVKMVATADKISALAKQFAVKYDGSTFGSVDASLPKGTKGTPYKQ